MNDQTIDQLEEARKELEARISAAQKDDAELRGRIADHMELIHSLKMQNDVESERAAVLRAKLTSALTEFKTLNDEYATETASLEVRVTKKAAEVHKLEDAVNKARDDVRDRQKEVEVEQARAKLLSGQLREVQLLEAARNDDLIEHQKLEAESVARIEL